MRRPILVSHQGKVVQLHPDGRMTTTDGDPLPLDVRKPTARPQKRWHDPYG